MATVTLEGSIRESVGTGSARASRRSGAVPCVVYGGDTKEPEHIAIAYDSLKMHIFKTNFFSTVFEINGINGKSGQKFVAKDVQYHPLTDQPTHIDFMRVGKGSKVTVRIPLKFVNDQASPGLKYGGVLNVLVHEIDVVCDPDSIPDSIDIDLTGFEFHHTVHAYDVNLNGLSLPNGVKNFTIATVVAPTIMKRDDEESTTPAATTTA